MDVIPNVHKASKVGDCDTEGSGDGGGSSCKDSRLIPAPFSLSGDINTPLPLFQLPEKALECKQGRVRGLPEMGSCKAWGESECTGHSLPHR